jgi:CHAT domain-containing protein
MPIEMGTLRELLGDLAMHRGDWHGALDAYDLASPRGDFVSTVGRDWTATVASMLDGKAAYCFCRLGRPADAVMRLERNKTRGLVETLAWERLARLTASKEQRARLRKLLATMRHLEAEGRRRPGEPGRPPDAELTLRTRAAREELESLKRAPPESAFEPDLAADAVLAQAPANGAIVFPIVTDVGATLVGARGDMSSLDSAQITDADLTLAQLKKLQVIWAAFLMSAADDLQAASPLLERIAQELWERLMAHVVRLLEELKVGSDAQVVIVSQFGLGSLPLHAAAPLDDPGSPVATRFAVECIPGVALAAECRTRPAPTSNQSTGTLDLLAVADPSGSLPNAEVELDLIREPLGRATTLVLGRGTTEADVREASAQAPARLHFACHARSDLTSPWLSGLTVSDGTLTAAEVAFAGGASATELVVLSACETGVSDLLRAPNEHGSLATAFLVSGARGVVTSLWSVSDTSTALLMGRFYELHERGNCPTAPALRMAALWLRAATVAELCAWLQRAAERHRGLRGEQRRPRRRLAALRAAVGRRGDPDSRPFEAPIYWAPFVALDLKLN